MIKNRNIAPDAAIELSKILGAGSLGIGRIMFVAPAASQMYTFWASRVNPKDLFLTVADAYAQATSDQNDVIVLAPTTHTLTSMLTVAKNRVHFVGADIGNRLYGQEAKIVMGVTTATTDLFAVKNTGVRNSFIGIKFDSGNTLTQAIGTVGEGGEYAMYRNCEFYNSVKLDSDTHAELVLNGDSAQFIDCTFGSIADQVSGNKVRPAVITTGSAVVTGAVCRDVYFDRCRFWKNAGGTGTAMIKIAADNDLERGFELHDCTFTANKLGSVPAVAIALGASLTKSQILLSGDTIALNCTKIATGTGVFNGTPARVATATIAIQAT